MSLIGDTISINGLSGAINASNVTVSDGDNFPGTVEAQFVAPNAFTYGVDVDGDSFTVFVLNTQAIGKIVFSSIDFTLSDLNWVDNPNGYITAVTATDGSGITPTFTNTDDSGTNPNTSTITSTIPAFELQGGESSTYNFDITTECFLTGTHILTDKGEITVENLQIGDRVVTAEGKLEPIKWIGYQTVKPHQVKNPLRGYPILIKAGALGHHLPQRDLYVSPDHGMYFEGVLINAGALVNSTSIIKTEPKAAFTYYHVELENHALLSAEGASAERYLPRNEDRLAYENGAEYEELYPYGSNLMLWPMDYPRVNSWVKVPWYMRKKLNAIAEELGFALQAV